MKQITLNFQTLRESVPLNESEILFVNLSDLKLRYGTVIYKWYEYDEEDCSTGNSYWKEHDEEIDTDGYRLHLEISEEGTGTSEDYGRLDNLSDDIIWTLSDNSNCIDKDLHAIAHELWALSQLAPGEGILDGVERIVECLKREFQ